MTLNQSTAPAKTPGIVTAAFVLSIFGFVCGIPAVLGVILGFVGRPKAKAANSGVGMATAAIVIGAAWLVLGAVAGVVSLASSGSSPSVSVPSTPVTVPSAPSSPAPQSVDASEAAVAEEEPQPESVAETVSQENAREKAASYLEYSAFSRKGLIGQLEYEGFSTDDATYGVDAMNADWNEQAALKAESYLEYSSFSRQGLIEQLEYEGFTPSQAKYGVNAVGL